MIDYVPERLERPKLSLDGVSSAWMGHEQILADLIRRFDLKTESAMEFGVEFGFSTVALASYFDRVVGVDLFSGDIHTENKEDHFDETRQRLEPYENITLVKSDYRDFIALNDSSFDLIHVDIVHTYEDTFACGLWSVEHSKCAIFHDTESFSEVRMAVHDIAKRVGKKFYNYPKHHGLGIVV